MQALVDCIAADIHLLCYFCGVIAFNPQVH